MGEDFSAEVLDAARTVKITPDEQAPGVWWVDSATRPGKTYRVQVTRAHTLCTCPHGLNASGNARCKHVAAVVHSTCPHTRIDASGRKWVCASPAHHDDRHYLVRKPL